MNYKEEIYQAYVSNHTSDLYGANSIEKIKSHFSSWQFYYGKYLPAELNATILDLGCGDGGFVYWLLSKGFNQTSGIDISEEQIRTGHELGIEQIRCANLAETLQNVEHKYDMIVARDVIEHFIKKDIYEMLQVIHRALKPGGRLLIQVPNGEGIFYANIFYGDFTHETAFTQRSLNQVFRNTGYNQITVKSVGPAPVGLVSSIRYLLWGGISFLWRLAKLIETGNPKLITTQNIVACAQKPVMK